MPGALRAYLLWASQEDEMGAKVPQKPNSKKPGKSVKEKRALKEAKRASKK